MSRKFAKQPLPAKQRLNVRKAYAKISPNAEAKVVSMSGKVIGVAVFDGSFQSVMERKLPA